MDGVELWIDPSLPQVFQPHVWRQRPRSSLITGGLGIPPPIKTGVAYILPLYLVGVMKRNLVEHRYFGTYYFADIVSDILDDPFDYLRNLEDFYGDGRYLDWVKPFQKFSALHGFIEFILDDLVYDQASEENLLQRQEQYRKFYSIPPALADLQPHVLFIERALLHFSIPHISFVDWLKTRGQLFVNATGEELDEYMTLMRDEGPYDELLERLVGEVFFLLFQNRRTLRAFNVMMAGQVDRKDSLDEGVSNSQYFASPGKLRRAPVPTWAKRAVFFRDRGICTSCGMDLSGILNISNSENYDHTVPLAKGGLNDVSNLQLLCADCNSRKSHRVVAASDLYEAWYSMKA